MRVAVVSDLHVPYHDEWAVSLAIEAIAVWQPDLLIFNGDELDFYELSDFDKDPEKLKQGGLQPAFDCWREIKRRFCQAQGGGRERKMTLGNHNARLFRWIARHSAIHGLRALELPALMCLDEDEIEYCPNEVLLANGNLVVKHGDRVRKESGASAQAELGQERYTVSTITGHTHRLGSTFVTHRNGVVVGLENGCLCDMEPEYIQRPNWQHGMTLVQIEGDAFHAFNVPFLGKGKDMKAMVDGRKVRP